MESARRLTMIKENMQRTLDMAAKGKLCPKCISKDVKLVGFNPDGIDMNCAYECKSCKYEWEGY